MVKANTIGQNNGEINLWIDGQLTGALAEFVFARSISTLKIDRGHNRVARRNSNSE